MKFGPKLPPIPLFHLNIQLKPHQHPPPPLPIPIRARHAKHDEVVRNVPNPDVPHGVAYKEARPEGAGELVEGPGDDGDEEGGPHGPVACEVV